MTDKAATWMIYGVTGYTGRLLGDAAAAAGLKFIAAGRNVHKVTALAQQWGVEARVFDLADAQIVQENLANVALVLHAAGPFVETCPPMLAACIAQGAHYLDITGEVPVFRHVYEHDRDAKERGVIAIPGVGFDVVPTDCVANLLKQQMPDAQKLVIGISSDGASLSAGTAKSALNLAGQGPAIRQAGRLVYGKAARLQRQIPFPSGTKQSVAIPWGDLESAFLSTGIPHIETYMGVSDREARGARLLPLAQPALRFKPVVRLLQRGVDRVISGPSEQRRQTGKSEVWAEVENGRGERRTLAATMPDGYRFTVDAALAAVHRVLQQPPAPGAQTPAMAFGADFLAGLPDVTLHHPKDSP